MTGRHLTAPGLIQPKHQMIESIPTATADAPKLQLSAADSERLWSKIDRKGPDDCWLWRAGIDGSGYGQFSIKRKNNTAHRLVFQTSCRILGPQEWALHKCDTPACCNPAHLFAGTALDNNRDMMAKGRGRFIQGDNHYTRRNPEKVRRGEANHNAKLTDALVAAVRAAYKAGGVKQKDLAARFGISNQQTSAIILRKGWTHV